MKVLRVFLTALLIVLVVGAIGTAVLIRRGLRATAKPLPLEATLARTARDLAIPRAERRQKNPFQPASELIDQGREYFLNNCAICHGTDGSGKTQVGLNIYPSVPDLRAPMTQSLTDGEIHYIIENGVQFTGMPAWGTPHRGNLKHQLETCSLYPQSRLAEGPGKIGTGAECQFS